MEDDILLDQPELIEEPVEVSPLERTMLLAQASGDISGTLGESFLTDLASKVIADYEQDKTDRSEWEKVVKEALKAASQETNGETKTYPWPNAANIKYPLLTVAALQFNSRAVAAIIKGDEAISVKVIGKDEGKPLLDQAGQPVMQEGPQGPQPQWAIPPGGKAARAQRVREFLNNMLFYRMEDWKVDTDLLLLQLPIVGCVFRKVWYDARRDMQCASLVPALRLYAPKGAKSCKTATRLTEEIPDVYPVDLQQKIRDGFYRDIDLFAYLVGTDESIDDEPRTILEQHRLIDIDEDGLPEPYIVTVDQKTAQVLRIEPNFGPENLEIDEAEQIVRRIEAGQFYIKYDFLPHPEGKFYGIGLGHLLKQIGGVIDTAINQMIDAGTAQVAGGGFIGSGVRLQGSKRSGNLRFLPGEYKTVDVPGDALRNGIVERTFPGPSQVMFSVLEMMLGAAQDISSVKDVITGEASNNGQVGTTLALIEQGLQVFNAIYKRIYWAEQEEFSLLYRNIGRYATEATKRDYVELLDDPQADFDKDFNQRDMDIRPVSDPSSVTKLQQMARAQFLGGFVNLPWVNGPAITKRMLEAADVEDTDELFVPMTAPEPDPVAQADAQQKESAAILNIEKAQTEKAERERMAIDNFAKLFQTGHSAGIA